MAEYGVDDIPAVASFASLQSVIATTLIFLHFCLSGAFSILFFLVQVWVICRCFFLLLSLYCVYLSLFQT